MNPNSSSVRFRALPRQFAGHLALCGFVYFCLLLSPNALAQDREKPFAAFTYAPQFGAEGLPARFSVVGFGHQAPTSQTGSKSAQLGSPPLGKFGKQLLSNFKNLFSTANIKPFVIGSAATAVSIPLDDPLKNYFGEKRRAKPIGEVGAVIGHPVVLGAAAGGALLWSYNTSNDRFRSMSFTLTQALIVDYSMTAALRLVVPRDRPDASGRLSFPSGHSSGTFAAATVISHYYKKALIPAYATACFVGFARIEKNKHHLTDVVFGATLGIITARTAVRGTNTLLGGKITWMPRVLPEGGVAVFITLTPDW